MSSEYSGEPRSSFAGVLVGVRGGDTVSCLGVNDEDNSRDGATAARQSLGALHWRLEWRPGTTFGEITSNSSGPTSVSSQDSVGAVAEQLVVKRTLEPAEHKQVVEMLIAINSVFGVESHLLPPNPAPVCPTWPAMMEGSWR